MVTLKSVMAAFHDLHFTVSFTPRIPQLAKPTMTFNYTAAGVGADISDVMDIASQLVASFNTIPSGASKAPAAYLAGSLNPGTNLSKWEVYDVTDHLDGTRAGSPVAVGSWTASAIPNAASLPEACAAVVTLQAPYGTDVEFAPGTRPRARDRGRIYFGPLNSLNAWNTDLNNHAILNSAFQTDLGKWIKKINIITSVPHTLPYALAVWSRRNHAMKGLAECWVDERFDYRRPRAGDATNRIITPLP